MQTVPLNEVFEVHYGVNLELNKLEESTNGINFVSRISKNNGVKTRVKLLEGVEPIPAGMLTVAGGGSVLETFLQDEPFYSGRDLYFLKPKIDLSEKEKLVYCSYIKANKYRYNYGRQANKTLGSLLIPHPDEIKSMAERIGEVRSPSQTGITNKQKQFKLNKTIEYASVDSIFDVSYGVSLSLNSLEESTDTNAVPFVSRTRENNGVSAFVTENIDIPLNPKGTLSVAGSGSSVLEVFLQDESYYSGFHLFYLVPKKEMSKLELLFYATIIRKNKYRYNYGRQANKTLGSLLIPIFESTYINDYMGSLPSSSNIS